jgi:SAM-dependent methyltransferase
MFPLTQPSVFGRGRCLALLAAFYAGRLLLPAADGPGQASNPTNRYEFHAEHDRDGIGKFFLGREIAQVMGHEAAAWLERPEREEEEQPDLLISRLKLSGGMTVADIGAGTGYYSRRMAERVGLRGKVLAVDIQPEMLALLTNRMAAVGINNVVPVLGTAKSPKLEAGTVDLALLVDVYHEFDFPFEMMEDICRALRPGGRVVLVEYRAEDPEVPIKPLHKMTQAQVRKEMSLHPVQWLETIEVLPWQHIMVFGRMGP